MYVRLPASKKQRTTERILMISAEGPAKPLTRIVRSIQLNPRPTIFVKPQLDQAVTGYYLPIGGNNFLSHPTIYLQVIDNDKGFNLLQVGDNGKINNTGTSLCKCEIKREVTQNLSHASDVVSPQSDTKGGSDLGSEKHGEEINEVDFKATRTVRTLRNGFF